MRKALGWILVAVAAVCIVGMIIWVYGLHKAVIGIVGGSLLAAILFGGLHLINKDS